MTRNRGFSLIELLLVVTVILIILAFALPSLIATVAAGREASTANLLTEVVKSEKNYFGLYGTYAPTAAALGGPVGAGKCPAVPTPTTSCFLADGIAAQLNSGTVGQYSYVYTLNPDGSFTMTATPVSSSSGRKSFYADLTGVSYQNSTSLMTAPGTPLGQ